MTRGFTLIETVIVIALFVVMMSALATLYLSFSTSTVVQKSLADNTSRSARALATLHTDVSQAQSVLASYSSSSGTTYFSSSTALVLALPAIDAPGNVIDGSYDYVIYFVNGSSLYRRIEAAASSHRANGVTLLLGALGSVVFTYDNADFTQVTRVNTDLISAAAPHTSVRSQSTDTSYLYNHT